MPQAAPIIPDLDEFGVLDLDELAGRDIDIVIPLTNVPIGHWFHPHWRGTTVDGQAADITGPVVQILQPDLTLLFNVSNTQLLAIDQGHAHFFYTVQPTEQYQHGQEESLRALALVGKRPFPGSGLNVAIVERANGLQFNASDLAGAAAQVTVLPWQAMRSGDVLLVTWRGYRPDGREIAESREVEITASAVGWPVETDISLANIRLIAGGSGLLSYQVTYADSGKMTRGPTQNYAIVPAAPTRLSALVIAEHSGPTLDPALFEQGLTFNIAPYPDRTEGDVLVFYVQDVANGLCAALASVRLDLSAVDSERMQCRIAADWLVDYLDRDIVLTYHVARPRHDLASDPLALAVRATMNLPVPIVEGASGAGQERGEFKAQDSRTGIKVWVPSLAVYPESAGVEMHWEGAGSAGSQVVGEATGETPPAFVFSPTIVAANMGKDVRIFYRVHVVGEPYRDSRVFILKIIPIPQTSYPTLICVQATNGVLRVGSLSAAGSTQTVAPWPLIAQGQLITITVAGRLKAGPAVQFDLLKDDPVSASDVSGGISIGLTKRWLDDIRLNSDLSFTVKVSADGGATWVLFPRVYINVQA